MAEQSMLPRRVTRAGPFTLVAFASGANRSVWECATCQGPIGISCRTLEHVDQCTALMANNKPCERMYSTRYGCSKHPYYEGHNQHMHKYLCQVPIVLPSLSNLMPKSKTPSPKRPSTPVDDHRSLSGLGQARVLGPKLPPPAPPSTPQPGQPKLDVELKDSYGEGPKAKTEFMSLAKMRV